MKRKNKKIMLVSINPEIKEMLRYQAYKSRKSQNNLIEEILKSYLEEELSNDIHFKELANI
jgi:predicted HicB family RNase H-like nuclease